MQHAWPGPLFSRPSSESLSFLEALCSGTQRWSTLICIFKQAAEPQSFSHRTYTERHLDRVPVNALSLAPERAGKKNLKKVQYLLSAEQDEAHVQVQDKPRLVIVGGGWAAVSILKKLRSSKLSQFLFAHSLNTFLCLKALETIMSCLSLVRCRNRTAVTLEN